MNEKLKFLSNRWSMTIGLFVFLASLVTYGYLHNPVPKLSKCLADPLRYDGQQIGVGNEAKIVELKPNGFIVKELGREIQVIGDSQNASLGDFIRIRAIFHKEGYLELKQLYVAKRRRAKIYVSIVPVLLVFFLLFRAYRIDWPRLLFREKS